MSYIYIPPSSNGVSKEYVDDNFFKNYKKTIYNQNAGEPYSYVEYTWGEEYPFRYTVNKLIGSYPIKDDTYYVAEVKFNKDGKDVELIFENIWYGEEGEAYFLLVYDSTNGEYSDYEFYIGNEIRYYNPDETQTIISIPYYAIGYEVYNEDWTGDFVGIADIEHHLTIYEFTSDVIDSRQVSRMSINNIYDFPIEILTDSKINLLDYANASNMSDLYFTDNYICQGKEWDGQYYYQGSGGKIIESLPINFSTNETYIKIDNMVHVYKFDFNNPYVDCDGKTRYCKFIETITYFDYITKKMSYDKNANPTESHHLTDKKYVDDSISKVLKFNANGELEITINGVTKVFTPKE